MGKYQELEWENDMKKFIITVDTEGDSQWDLNASCSTQNAKFIPRFQELAEKYGFFPTWLTNYEMSDDKFFVEYIRDCLKRGTCEVGMHLHAWNNPPEYKLAKKTKERDYLFEYPVEIMEKKIKFLTEKLEDTFSVKMLSQRSGRWSTDENYFKLLHKYGYKTDCSVTPLVNWSCCVGATGKEGSDYSQCSLQPYYIYRDILEVPVSIRNMKTFCYDSIHIPKDFCRELKRFFLGRNAWLRPTKNLSFKLLKDVLDRVNIDSDYAMFMIHSSEMMPGGSPSFPSLESIEQLYSCIEKIFSYAKNLGYTGCKLSDYRVRENNINAE